ncbi:hypothetical protein TIFTF001_024693 [Ficus carica]|uniref:Uncharacterized protein n=1 Tax=Ficus carica TaxID=3494 RepID=A0AA88AHA6_FICCA|nr:hypothetical protein TIFTF001_024693 [Ficus carica]
MLLRRARETLAAFSAAVLGQVRVRHQTRESPAPQITICAARVPDVVKHLRHIQGRLETVEVESLVDLQFC